MSKVSVTFRVLASLALLFVGGYLLNDALSFGLAEANLATGRIKGCYTAIESLLGLLRPSDTIRISQALLSLAAVMGAMCFLYASLRMFVRGRGNTPVA
jgi:hypothetical protein